MRRSKIQSTKWKERRRLHAVELRNMGWKQKEIAIALDVGEGAVSCWLRLFKEQGIEGLRSHPHTGRSPKLTNAQKQLLLDFLSRGVEAYGFRGNLWTSQRIGKVIEMEFGVIYHRSHVTRLLKELKWTPQQPTKHASQRNQAEIDYWIKNIWEESVLSGN